MEIYKNEYRIIKVDLGIDISDYEEIKFSVKENKTDSDDTAILSLSYLSGDIGIYDATSGYISITIDAIDLDIVTGSYFYDIQLTDINNNEVLTATDGKFIVSERTTQTTVVRANGISGSVTFSGGYGNVGGNCVIIFDGDTNYYTYLQEGESNYYKEVPAGTYDLTCNANNYTADTITGVVVTENNINTGNNFTLETQLAGASGTVTLVGQGNLQDVIIEVGDETVHPDENGEYEIWVDAGTYDINAYLDNAVETIEGVTLTAGANNIVTGQDFELTILDVIWIKCSGDSGTYIGGLGYRDIPDGYGYYVYSTKWIKFSQNTFVAYFQEMKIELNSGVPTISINLLADGVETTIYSYTFDGVTLNINTKYKIWCSINYDEGANNWRIRCYIYNLSGNILDWETLRYDADTLAWNKTLNGGWWGKINSGDIYIKDMGAESHLHRWRLSNMMGNIIEDDSLGQNQVDLELSGNMTKIYE